jgi:hypothetical protein
MFDRGFGKELQQLMDHLREEREDAGRQVQYTLVTATVPAKMKDALLKRVPSLRVVKVVAIYLYLYLSLLTGYDLEYSYWLNISY